MKREQAKEKIFHQWQVFLENNIDYSGISEAYKMAIKALEQEPILDKIRTEIENHCGLVKEDHCKYCSYCNSVMGVREILEIIDKYMAESGGGRRNEL